MTTRTGNRQRLPADALKHCASCGRRRGNVRKGWATITRDGRVAGWTCPECPTAAEPIRRKVGKTGRVSWRAVVDATPAGARERKQAQRTFTTLEEARAWVEQVRAEVQAAGAYAAPTVETVEALCERWLASRRDVRPITVQGYRSDLATVNRRIGSRDVRSLTVKDIEELIAWIAQEGGRRGQALGPRSVRSAMVALGQVLDVAVREGALAQNPARLARRPRHRKVVGKDLQHWQPGELLAFRDHADTDAWAGAWRLTLSGMTRADVMGLRWSDLDLEVGVASVAQGRIAINSGGDVDDPKSAQRVRAVPFEAIHPESAALLRAMKRRQAEDKLRAGGAWQDSGYVVVDALGRPIRPEVYSDRFRRLCETGKVPSITLHSVRHSLAFWLHQLGVAPADAAALLGHTVEVHLSTYLPHSGAAGITAAARALGQAAGKRAGAGS